MIRRLLSWSVGPEIWHGCGFRGQMAFLEVGFQESHSYACRLALKGGRQ